MKPNHVLIDPQDVLVQLSSKWKEIAASTAHLLAAHIPVAVAYRIQGRLQAVLLGAGWASEHATSYLDALGTRFYKQVGSHPSVAKSAVPKSMALSAAGADFIGKGYENPSNKGYDSKTRKYFAYDDGYGYPTIGYGHLIKSGENFSQGLTDAQVRQLFLSDIGGTVSMLNRALKVGLAQNQFDALVSLTFNVGNAKTRPVRVLNAGGAVGISDFTTYDHVKKVVSRGLLARRKAEWKIFSQNVYDPRH